MATTKTSPINPNVLDIDLKGYRQTLANKGKPRILVEGLSNAFDTNTDVVVVTFAQKDGWADLVIKDNDPDGFTSLKDAWTLFAASNRREDAESRGRFGQGEKELIAIAVDGGILELTSTKGSVRFTREGRQQSPTRTPHGTVLVARLKLNQAEAKEFERLVSDIIVPEGVVFTFNDKVNERPVPVKTVRETLPTVIWDAEGNIVNTRRQTSVEFFEVSVAGRRLETEAERANVFGRAWIYELGVPVVEHDGRFHINVGQKVPLNSARDNVTPAYLRKLWELMLESTLDLLTPEDHKEAWVATALPNASEDATRAWVAAVHGEDAVIFDPSNPEASKRAIEEGRDIVYGRSIKPEVWQNVKKWGILKPAGQVIEVGVPTSLDGMPPITDEEWTPAMHNLALYTQQVGLYLLDFQPGVEFQNAQCGARAMWGNRTIIWNLHYLGKSWPQTATRQEVDELILHEFAHHMVSDHLSDAYNKEVCRLGAALRDCPVTLR